MQHFAQKRSCQQPFRSNSLVQWSLSKTDTAVRSIVNPRQSPTIHQLAERGTTGSPMPLPHLDKIQQSFGAEHDLSQVKAYVGGPAAQAARQMNAQAYAMGNQIAFASPPDLHIAAHEAAHIVQQRQGLQLPGGIGQANDPYERHADTVADRVVSGSSVANILHGSNDSAQAATNSNVQMYADMAGAGLPYDLLSDDGKMAVRDHSTMPGQQSSNIAASNAILDEINGAARIEELAGQDVVVTAPDGGATQTSKSFA